jgi:CHAT domain-containing protein/cytochrome c-type biogenesis protein CcmH/NrfG
LPPYGDWRSLPAAAGLASAAMLALACGPTHPPAPAPPRSPAQPSQVKPTNPAPAARPPAAFVLRTGPGQERELAGGGRHVYEIDLAAGQYLCATFEQRGVDVFVDVIAPGGRTLFQVDSPNDAQGPETVHLVAEARGRYRLEVGAVSGASPGRYLAKIETLRAATATDRRRAGAERAFHEARVLGAGEASFWHQAARYERAIRLFEEIGDRSGQALGMLSLGRLELGEGHDRDAIELFRRANRLERDLRDRRYIAVTWNELGRAYGAAGQVDLANQAFGHALRAWRALPAPAGEANTLLNRGELEQAHGHSWQALEDFRQSHAISHRLRRPAEEVNALNGIGWVYRTLGDWERSRDAHLAALRVLTPRGDPAARAIALTQLGHVDLDAAAPERALLYLEKAWSLERSAGDAGVRAVTLNALGLCDLWLGRYGSALVRHRQTLEILRSLPNPRGETDAWINLGWAYDRLGEPGLALDCLHHALRLAQDSHDLSSAALALLGMALVERDRGDQDAALKHAETAIAIVESLRLTAFRSDLQASYLARRGSSYGLLIELLMARHPQRDFALRALARSEQARSRGLLDALLESRQRASSDKLLADQRRIADEIAALDRKRQSPLPRPAPAAVADRALAEAIERLNEAELRIRETRARPSPPQFESRTLQALLQQMLDPQTLLLEYYIGDSRGYLWAATSAGSVQTAELPGRDRLEPLVRSLYSHFAQSSPDPDPERDRQALVLSRLLFGPVASQWSGKRLLIAAQGALQYLPFGVLPEPTGGHAPLVAGHEIAYVPSLAVLAGLRERGAHRTSAARLLAVVADPVLDAGDERLVQEGREPRERNPESPDLPRLGSSRVEAQAIASLLPRQDVLTALDFGANRELVTEGHLDGFRILHFATHALLRSDRPELSALVLSLFDRRGHPRDGLVRSADLAHLDLRAELVVLSACRSGLGAEIAGEGLLGLPQSFLRAGAQRVLVSLWDVDDRAAAELMRQFYRRLLSEHLAPARALREAQLFIRQQPLWQAPYYWGGFVLQGCWP